MISNDACTDHMFYLVKSFHAVKTAPTDRSWFQIAGMTLNGHSTIAIPSFASKSNSSPLRVNKPGQHEEIT